MKKVTVDDSNKTCTIDGEEFELTRKKPRSVLYDPIDYNTRCHMVAQGIFSGLFIVNSPLKDDDPIKNVFREESDAQDFADALNVLFELRVCDGVSKITDDKQYTLEIDYDSLSIFIDKWESSCYKFTLLMPVFSSREATGNAIKKVGEERIKKAFKTWHRV